MTTTHHTPGDWQRNFDQIIAVHSDEYGEHETLICDVFDEHDWWRGKASAAPEMFDALALCEEVLSGFARLDDGTPSVSALHMARDALARAKGGQP